MKNKSLETSIDAALNTVTAKMSGKDSATGSMSLDEAMTFINSLTFEVVSHTKNFDGDVSYYINKDGNIALKKLPKFDSSASVQPKRFAQTVRFDATDSDVVLKVSSPDALLKNVLLEALTSGKQISRSALYMADVNSKLDKGQKISPKTLRHALEQAAKTSKDNKLAVCLLQNKYASFPSPSIFIESFGSGRKAANSMTADDLVFE